MSIRTSMHDGGGPSLVGAIVFAVFVAVNLAAGPGALSSTFTRATAAGRSAVASVIRRAATLALRYGEEEGVEGSQPAETCPPWASPRGRRSMKTRTCEVRIRCDARARSGDDAPIPDRPSARPWICRSPT